MSRARDLSRLSNPTNFTPIASNGRVGLGSTNPTAKLNVVGVVSATAFYGDGSNLEGVASAGLGTAVEAGSAFGGEQIYYTCLLYTSPSPRDKRQSRMPSSA